jgi:hypothetical protein
LLARALRQLGEQNQAIAWLFKGDESEAPEPALLMELAAAQRELGRDAASEQSLTRAIALRPASVAARRQLASLYQSQGHIEAAQRQHKMVSLLGDVIENGVARARTDALSPSLSPPLSTALSPAASPAPSPGPASARRQLDGLIMAFGLAPAEPRRAVLLGVTHRMDWRGQILSWLRPRTLDVDAVRQALRDAIDPHYDRTPLPESSPEQKVYVQRLLGSENDTAADAESITRHPRPHCFHWLKRLPGRAAHIILPQMPLCPVQSIHHSFVPSTRNGLSRRC